MSSLWFPCIGPSVFPFYCFLQSALHFSFMLCSLSCLALLSKTPFSRLLYSLSSPLFRTSLRSSAIFTASPDKHLVTSFLLAPFCLLSPSLYHGYRSIILPVLCLLVEVRWTCSSPLQQTPIRCSPRHISVSVWLIWFALTWSWHLLSAGCGPSQSAPGSVVTLLTLLPISFCMWCNRSDFLWFGPAISMCTASVHVTWRKCSWSWSHFDYRIQRVGLPTHSVPPVRIFQLCRLSRPFQLWYSSRLSHTAHLLSVSRPLHAVPSHKTLQFLLLPL